MNVDEFMKKLETIPEDAPDATDLAMLSQAEKENDGETMTLEATKEWLDYSGKLVIRIPKSLHFHLTEEAKEEGVSLNQYILYKLAQ